MSHVPDSSDLVVLTARPARAAQLAWPPSLSAAGSPTPAHACQPLLLPRGRGPSSQSTRCACPRCPCSGSDDDALLAYQIAFDLVDAELQAFMLKVGGRPALRAAGGPALRA